MNKNWICKNTLKLYFIWEKTWVYKNWIKSVWINTDWQPLSSLSYSIPVCVNVFLKCQRKRPSYFRRLRQKVSFGPSQRTWEVMIVWFIRSLCSNLYIMLCDKGFSKEPNSILPKAKPSFQNWCKMKMTTGRQQQIKILRQKEITSPFFC